MVDPDFARAVVSWLSPLLFGVGVAGVFARRSSLAMTTGLQFMVLASVLALVEFDLLLTPALSAGAPERAQGQAFGVSLVVLVAAQAVLAVGLVVARARLAARKRSEIPW